MFCPQDEKNMLLPYETPHDRISTLLSLLICLFFNRMNTGAYMCHNDGLVPSLSSASFKAGSQPFQATSPSTELTLEKRMLEPLNTASVMKTTEGL